MIVLDKWNNVKMEENVNVTNYLHQINFISNQLRKINEYPKESIIVYKIM